MWIDYRQRSPSQVELAVHQPAQIEQMVTGQEGCTAVADRSMRSKTACRCISSSSTTAWTWTAHQLARMGEAGGEQNRIMCRGNHMSYRWGHSQHPHLSGHLTAAEPPIHEGVEIHLLADLSRIVTDLIQNFSLCHQPVMNGTICLHTQCANGAPLLR